MGQYNNIPQGWMETSLGELIDIYNQKRIPLSTQVRNSRQGIYPYYGASNIVDYIDDYIFDGEFLLISEDGENLNTRNTPIAFIAKGKFWVNNHAHIVKGKSEHLTKYLELYFSKLDISAFITGAVQPKLSKGNLVNIPILISESSKEQKAIARVLTAFDDKIELLQTQNKTLESMAQTIFKDWFGKYQIGDELPVGWRVGEFGEVIEFINGYAFKSKDLFKEPIDNAYKVFKMGDIKKGGGFNPGKTKGYYPKSMSTKLNKYILKNGDLLMSMTDMKDAISLLGHTALMIYDDEYIVNQRVGLIRVKNDLNIEYPYLYLLTNNDDFIAGIRAGANSGVQVNLSTQGIKETEFVIADKETNKAFNNVVMPLFEKRKANYQMIKALTKTRDTLIPKLMSGQVRVNNIKQTANA